MLPSAGIQVSTHNLEERGEQGQVRSSSQDCGLAHTQKPGLILQNHAVAFLIGRRLSGIRGRQEKAEADGRPRPTRHTRERFTNDCR